ncbi:MAG TPA: ribonuclease HII [Anaerolineales bacterium]|nr:ribonuclease HII [Anaerolineales bacterium]HLF02807.1 ribonuclease HII [Anaerolineales bacterium]
MPQPSASRPSLRLERRFLSQGHRLIAGIDEAGRGAWAGPVVAAAVILPLDRPNLLSILKGVNDSKQLTAREREKFFGAIREAAVSIGVGGAGPGEVDRDGLIAATRAAMQRAVVMLHPQPEALLIDAVNLQSLISIPQHFLNYGDSISLSIAAASIVAKVTRDRAMTVLDSRYPGYGFARHKGYGTAVHRAVLEQIGVSEVHRASYAPVKELLQKE